MTQLQKFLGCTLVIFSFSVSNITFADDMGRERPKILRLFLSFFTWWQTPNTSRTSYDTEKERARVLGLLANIPVPKVQINSLDKVSIEKRRMLIFFRDIWAPYADQIHRHNISWYIYLVALDRALYRDEAEKKRWQAEMVEHLRKKNEIMQSQEFRSATDSLYNMTRGMSGDFVELVTRYWESMNRFEHKAESKPLTDEVAQVRSTISQVQNNSPVSPRLGEYSQKALELTKKYYRGELTLEEAAKQWISLLPISLIAKGEDVGKRGEAHFNRLAVLLSKLAKSLGYRTHAEYILAQKERYHSPELQTIRSRIAMMENLLEQTKPVTEQLIRHLLRQTGSKIKFEDLTPAEMAFLLPETDSMVSEYFPKENVEKFWRNFFIESGFSQSQLDNLMLDSYPREGKQTHAYMASQSLHKPRIFEVDANSLEVVIPDYSDEFWYPAIISVVQNVKADRAADYGTVGHESGHFLEYSNQSFTDGPFMLIDHEGDPVRSTMWAETPSQAMEKVLDDPEFLVEKARNRKGEPMPRALAELFINNISVGELIGLRAQMAGALLDYQLWDYDYETGNETFVDRFKRLDREIKEKYMFYHPIKNSPVDLAYSRFATDHWTSGNVKYEYIFASISAIQLDEWLLDELARTTGRRTYLRQPTLAHILIDQVYRHSSAMPYPTNIEKITEKKYDVASVISYFQEQVQNYINSTKNTCPGLF